MQRGGRRAKGEQKCRVSVQRLDGERHVCPQAGAWEREDVRRWLSLKLRAGRQDAGEVGLRGQGGWKRLWADQYLPVQTGMAGRRAPMPMPPTAMAMASPGGVCADAAPRLGFFFYFNLLLFFFFLFFAALGGRPWSVCACPTANLGS